MIVGQDPDLVITITVNGVRTFVRRSVARRILRNLQAEKRRGTAQNKMRRQSPNKAGRL